MAGMKVVGVACDEAGNIDVEDLRAKAAQHSETLIGLDDYVSIDPRGI